MTALLPVLADAIVSPLDRAMDLTLPVALITLVALLTALLLRKRK